jgi:hypothetical protein
VCTVLALLALAAGPQAFAFEIAPRIGYTSDENFDQIHIGGHVELAQPVLGLSFRPGIEVGFGDDVTFIAINGDMVYTFPELATADWSFYAGGGLALNIIKADGGGDNEDLGLNAVGGIVKSLESGNDLFFELRLGVEDSPDVKLTLGLTLF